MHETPRPIVARSVHTTWVYTLGSLVFFFVMLQLIVVLTILQVAVSADTTATPLTVALLLLIVIAAAAQIRCCWFLRAGLGGGTPDRLWMLLLTAPAALAWLIGLAVPGAGLYAALPLWMTANVLAPLLRIRPRAVLLVLGLAATIAHPVLADALKNPLLPAESPAYTLVTVYGLLLPVMVLSSIWWWRIVVELDRHRRASAELAVAQERLRFAADLHDIQGHHLQVIALKTELAERLMQSNPQASRDNVLEAQQIARQALEETRSLVYGYRDVTLVTELENAREVLTASGAHCDLDLAALPDDVTLHRPLAMAVREATTNILRHSMATQVTICLRDAAGGIELLISNNGADAAGGPHGSGLAGLRERVAAVEGRLEAGAGAAPGTFELRVWVPEPAVAS